MTHRACFGKQTRRNSTYFTCFCMLYTCYIPLGDSVDLWSCLVPAFWIHCRTSWLCMSQLESYRCRHTCHLEFHSHSITFPFAPASMAHGTTRSGFEVSMEESPGMNRNPRCLAFSSCECKHMHTLRSTLRMGMFSQY